MWFTVDTAYWISPWSGFTLTLNFPNAPISTSSSTSAVLPDDTHQKSESIQVRPVSLLNFPNCAHSALFAISLMTLSCRSRNSSWDLEEDTYGIMYSALSMMHSDVLCVKTGCTRSMDIVSKSSKGFSEGFKWDHVAGSWIIDGRVRTRPLKGFSCTGRNCNLGLHSRYILQPCGRYLNHSKLLAICHCKKSRTVPSHASKAESPEPKTALGDSRWRSHFEVQQLMYQRDQDQPAARHRLKLTCSSRFWSMRCP